MKTRDTEHSLTDAKNLGAWSGGREDLRRLGEAIERLFADDREDLLDELRAVERRRRVRSAVRRVLRRPREDSTTAVTEFGRVTMSIESDKGTHTNHYEALLAEHDLVGVTTVMLLCSGTRRQCYLTLSNGYVGCRLSLTGEHRWVPGALRAIDDETRRNRTWWAQARKPAASVAAFVVVMVVAFSAFWGGLALVNNNTSLDGTPELIVQLACGLVFALGVLGVSWGIARAFPQFEIREPGRTTTRRKVAQSFGVLTGGFLVLVSIAQGIAWFVSTM